MRLPISIELTDAEWEWLRAGAELRGVTVERLVTEVLSREASKQYHIVRCQPKPKEQPKALGRPPVSAAEKQIRELEQFLTGIYAKLRALHGEEYLILYGAQDERLRKLLEVKDLAGLAEFAKEQPWQKRR